MSTLDTPYHEGKMEHAEKGLRIDAMPANQVATGQQ